MQLKDKYGVPLEPVDEPLLEDWQDQPLYESEEGYETVHGIVRDDDQEILKYFRETHDKIWIGR